MNGVYIRQMTTKECIDYTLMTECGIATAEELNLARDLLEGSWEEVLNAVLYIRTGYRDFDQMLGEED